MNKPPKPQKNKSDVRVQNLEQQLQRVAADFDNFRKRTQEESAGVFKIAQASTLLELAPVLDNFRRATEHLPEHLQNDNWVTGVLYIAKQLEQVFEEHGVTKIKTVGEMFNPQHHEAVSTEPSDQPAQTILAELEGGYLLGDKVLKPAKVKVSSGPKSDSDELTA